MIASSPEKFFFIHIMKTGGTSFAQVMSENFEEINRYPYSAEGLGFFEQMESYIHVPTFVENVNANRENLRMISAHVPFATREYLQETYRTLTLLRDPVERTISYLKHCRRYHIEHQPMTLEEIYADGWFHATFMQNYQTKIFSMTAQEAITDTRLKDHHPTMPPRNQINIKNGLSGDIAELSKVAPGRFCMEFFAPSTGVISVDEQRLSAAKDSLDQIDVVGVTSQFDRFLSQLAQQHGWRIRSFPRQHVGEDESISAELRKQIAADNQYDLALFEYAQSIA